jgi:hypothetical protein
MTSESDLLQCFLSNVIILLKKNCTMTYHLQDQQLIENIIISSNHKCKLPLAFGALKQPRFATPIRSFCTLPGF